MDKFVLACVLTIACSTICIAKSTSKHQLAQASSTATKSIDWDAPPPSTSTSSPEPEPALHGALPVTGTPSVVTPSTVTTTTSTDSSTTTTFTNGASATPGGSTLQGAAHLTDITVSARNLTGCPLSRDHDQGLKYIEVTVRNDGQNIAVILGNGAHADVSAENTPAAPASAAEDSDLPRLNGKGKLAVGVVAAFGFGLAAPIFYENLTPEQHRKRDLGTAIGRDGSRHEVEAGHFGVRVIMPGDQTVGWIAFRCPRDQSVKSLVIPISYTRAAIPAGSVVVPVAQSGSN
jgi:hypothetical protein